VSSLASGTAFHRPDNGLAAEKADPHGEKDRPRPFKQWRAAERDGALPQRG
jgi:hypothetical protein